MWLLPETVGSVLRVLNENGHRAYIVGGCVRDLLLGKTPHDYDVTTSAEPEQVMGLFERVIPTGLAHGTVTVLSGGEPVEVTAFRTDGAYSDCRRPDAVVFVKSLREDLARRDFTVNAMAYHPQEGLQDLFGGQEDIKQRVLRAVGDPNRRFQEDALRILRLFRFASVLGFTPEPETRRAAVACAPLLEQISRERIAMELVKTLTGACPEALRPLTDCGGLGFLGIRRSPDYDRLPKNGSAELALFAFFTLAGADPDEAAARLKLSNLQKKYIHALNRLQAMPFPNSKTDLKQMLYETGEAEVRDALRFCAAADGADTVRAERQLTELLAAGEPYRLSDLAIDGQTLAAMGCRGKQIGALLEFLRRRVAADPACNTEQKLRLLAGEWLEQAEP